MKTTVVKKIAKLDGFNIVKFQFVAHFFVEDISVSDNEINGLVLLVFNNGIDSGNFVKLLVDQGVYKTPQTVKNYICRLKKNEFITKKNNEIFLSDKLQMVADTNNNILLDYKFYYEVHD